MKDTVYRLNNCIIEVNTKKNVDRRRTLYIHVYILSLDPLVVDFEGLHFCPSLVKHFRY